MTFTLPFPPSSNNAYASVRGRKVKSAAAREYARQVQFEVEDRIRTDEQPRPDLADKRLSVSMVAFPPDRRRRDLMNLEKLVTDAVFAQLGIDDSQVDRFTITRGHTSKNGGSIRYTIGVLHS